MGAKCVSCNSKSRADYRSGDCQRPSKCQNTNTPAVNTKVLPKQSYKVAGSNAQNDSDEVKQTQQDYQNKQSQETMPSAPNILSNNIQSAVESGNNHTESTVNEPVNPGEEVPFLRSTLSNRCQQSIPQIKSSIHFEPPGSGVYDTEHWKSKPPKRMQSEPSIGRSSLHRANSMPAYRQSTETYSAPPTRHQSVSEIQLEMAMAPLRFSAPAKTPPPSTRRTTIGMLFSSFSRKKEGERNKAEDRHKHVITTRDKIQKPNFEQVGSSTGMGSLTESISPSTISKTG